MLTLKIWKPRVSPDFDVVFLAIPDSVLHDQWVARMETTCDISMIDKGQQFQVGTTDIVPVGLSQVHI